MIWQIQEAKNKLSEVIARAETEGPQIITRRGHEVATVMSSGQYRKITRKKKSLSQFFRESPLVGQFKTERDRDETQRDVSL